MNSLADLPRLDRLVHLSCANVPTRREPAGLTLGRALALGASLIGIAAAVMVAFGIAHEGFGSAGPTLRIIALQEDTGRTIRATVEGFAPADCQRWRDRIGAALGNNGFKVEQQACEP